uniref:Uncharacterized protein n=1 Tax=Setaria italica TaxID=4555 RepID=K3ZBF7_SETIT
MTQKTVNEHFFICRFHISSVKYVTAAGDEPALVRVVAADRCNYQDQYPWTILLMFRCCVRPYFVLFSLCFVNMY